MQQANVFLEGLQNMRHLCEVSVIIPTKNRLDDLLITLSAIDNNKVLPQEVIVVDQTETNQAESIKEFLAKKHSRLNVVYYHEPQIPGRLFACDFGAAKSSGAWLLFLDDDVSVAEDFFERLSVIIQPNSGVDAVCAVDVSQKNLPLWKALLRVVFWRGPFSDPVTLVNKFYDKIDRPVKSRQFQGGYMCCKRHLYLEIGLDMNIPGGGDIDFSYRASKKYNLVLDPKLRVRHRCALVDSYGRDQIEFRRTRSRVYFFRKNCEKNISNYAAFSWLMFGTFMGTLSRSLSSRSTEPIHGFLGGLLSLPSSPSWLSSPPCSFARSLPNTGSEGFRDRSPACDISVIIPTKNRLEDLLVTLDALCKNKALPAEVVIVDQTKDDQGRAIRDFLSNRHLGLNVAYYHKPEISGVVPARDFGVSRSRGAWLVFLDDDVSVAEDFFERLSVFIRPDSNIDGVCAVDVSQEDTPLWLTLFRVVFWKGPFSDPKDFVEKYYDTIEYPVRSWQFSGGYTCCRREVYVETGVDENTLGHGEDLEFGYRASKKFNLVLDPKLRVRHRGGLTRLYSTDQLEFRRAYFRTYFFKKDIEKTFPNYAAFLWLMFGSSLGALARTVSSGSTKPLKSFIRGLSSAWKSHSF
jgi:glycosyltransferase involved in cell wall biosynthesis